MTVTPVPATDILLAVAILQLVTAMVGFVALLVSLRRHGDTLAEIKTATDGTNQVLQTALEAAHSDMSDLTHQLADEREVSP
jgi:hypothetical protein